MFPSIPLFGSHIPAYNLLMFVGFVVVLAAVLTLRPAEFPAKYAAPAVVISFVFGLIGSALLSIFLNAIAHQGWSAMRIIATSGLAYLGGLILGLTGLWIYCRILNVPFLVVADYAAPFLMLERVFDRTGCLLAGCCYGTRSDLPWAYPFLYDRPAHPTQAYELAIALSVLISSIYLYRKTARVRRINLTADPKAMDTEELMGVIRKAPPGGIVLFYVVMAYSFLRFFNEFFRVEGIFLLGPFKLSHLTLAIMAAASVVGIHHVIKISPGKEELLKALKGAIARLFVWLVACLVVILSLISIYNFKHASDWKYVPKTKADIPEVKQPVPVR